MGGIRGALVFFAGTIVFSAVGGGLLECFLKGLSTKLASVDRSVIPGPADDTALSAFQALATTTLATLVEALAWLVGCAANALFGSIWAELGMSEGNNDILRL